MVMCDTAQKSGSDATIIRIHNKDKAIAVSVDRQQTIVNHSHLLRKTNSLRNREI